MSFHLFFHLPCRSYPLFLQRNARQLLLSLLLILPLTTFSQLNNDTGNPFSVNLVPPSPEAAALAKYADIPVSLYSGTPQVEIPLYTVKERTLTLPLALSYHASGNKVETIAPRTGLGWSLIAGGVITRTVMGWPDEHGTRGFLHQAQLLTITDFALGYRPAEDQYQWYDAMAEGCMDAEPDVFFFNFAGYSGKFTFNWNGEIEIASGNNLKITPLGMNPGTADFINGWEVIADDGTIFIFDVIETSEVITAPDPNNVCRLGPDEFDMPQSWYLREIKSANQLSWIRFDYESYYQTTESWSIETQVHNSALSPAAPSRQKLAVWLQGKHLKRITTSSGQTVIDFYSGAQRTDVNGTVYTLGQIVVRNNRNRTIKDWRFDYDYSTGRLTLRKITEWAGTLSRPPFEFVYQSGALPDLLSFARDHWGFYNSNTAQTMIPATTVFRFGDPNPVNLSGADREPSASRVLYGLLREIKYPSGGKDILQFEPHDYSFEQNRELIEEVTIARNFYESAPDSGTPAGTVDTNIVEFSLPSETDVKVDTWFTYGMVFGSASYPITVTVRNKTTGEQLFFRSPGGTAYQDQNGNIYPEEKYLYETLLDVPAGVYEFVVSGKVAPGSIGQNYVSANVSYKEGTGQFYTEIKQGGGVRISRITRSFGNGNPDKITRYKYRITEGGVEKSSGSLLESGYRYEDWMLYQEKLGDGGTTGSAFTTVSKFFRFSQNRTALGTTQGSHVGYGTVTVLQGENAENGKTIYKYNSPREVVDYAHWENPYPPADSYDYRRGVLLEQNDFDKFNVLVKRLEYNYTFHQQEVQALKVGWALPGAGPRGADYLNRYSLGNYTHILGYSRQVRLQETTYHPGNPGTLTFAQEYLYQFNENTHKQLVNAIQRNSENDSIFTHFTYPQDYFPGSNAALDALRDRHAANTNIEKLSWKKNASAQTMLLSAIKTDFTVQSNKVYPLAVSGARIGEFVITTDPLSTAQSLYEERLVYYQHDAYGNPTAFGQKNGMSTTYLWGENGTVIIAKADHAQAGQIFHTSFEEDGLASSAYQKTGNKSKAVTASYAVPSANLPWVSGDYVLSWWMLDGTVWSYREKLIPNYQPGAAISTEPINGYLDEVRLYPKGAKMITHTYEPLVGITSVTDANNNTVYFEYDVFNSLTCKRDQDRNILECYEYKYQEQVPFAIQN